MNATHPGYNKEINCNSIRKRPKDYVFTPAPHQSKVRSFFRNSLYKGLLLYHKLGSGKSCTSIMVADDLLKNNLVKHVYVLTPGSLRKNWISEYCRVCGRIDKKDIMKKFTFITYNYAIKKHLSEYDFNDSLVIIDEVHNLINGFKNKSENKTALYEKVVYSNARVLCLSGTPVIQDDIFTEWKYLSKLLGKSIDDYKDIKELLNEDLEGIVSYYPGDPSKYPKVNNKPIQCIPMTIKQYELYKKVESRETKIRAMGPPDMGLFHRNPIKYNREKRAFIKAKNYLLTRMFSNCFYGEVDVEEKKEEEKSLKKKKNIDKEDLEDLEDLEDQEIRVEKKKILPDLLKKEGGWICSEKLQNRELFTISPKFSSVLLNIIKNFNSKHVIYSFYKTKAGIQLFYSLLKHCGIHVEVFSGDIDAKKREDILNRFNSIDNRRGKKIKVLLVTEAGAEGISILECNNIHILESSPKENKTRQAIGRVIRYKSHELLPKNEQFVNVWRYWSIVPKDEEPKKLVDEVLYKKGLVLEKHFENFTKRLIRNSIEVKD